MKQTCVKILTNKRSGLVVGGAYGDSCRSGVLQFMKTVGADTPSSLQGDLDLLLCFCSVAGTFITDVAQDGEFLAEGVR